MRSLWKCRKKSRKSVKFQAINEKGKWKTHSCRKGLPVIAVNDDLIAPGRDIHQHAERSGNACGLHSKKKRPVIRDPYYNTFWVLHTIPTLIWKSTRPQQKRLNMNCMIIMWRKLLLTSTARLGKRDGLRHDEITTLSWSLRSHALILIDATT